MNFMSNLSKKLKTLRKQIANKDNFIAPIISWNKGLRVSALEKAQKNSSFTIPDHILKIYAEFNGLTIDWRINDPKNTRQTILGTSNIPRLDYLFKNKQITIFKGGRSQMGHYWPDHASAEEVERFKNFYVFDNLKTGEFILVQVKDNQVHPSLFYYSYPDTFLELKIDVETYVETLIAMKGIYGWQSVFLPKEKQSEIFPPISTTLAQLKLIFPKDSFDEIIEKFKIEEGAEEAVSVPNEEMNYFNFFEDKMQQLKANKAFSKVSFKPNIGVHISTIRRAQRSLGFDIPEDMRSFYQYLNGFTLEWNFKRESIKTEGNIHLLSLENIFGGDGGILSKSWEGPKEFPGDTKGLILPSEVRFLKRIVFVEGVSRDTYVLLKPESKRPIFFLEKGDLVATDLYFKDYIKILLSTMGMEGWHQAYLSKDKAFLSKIAQIFPEEDFKPFSS